jgi:acetyl-CoA carboxylase biotin carboxyl carrier protein
LELKDIKELIALIRKNDLSEFSLEQEGFKITLKRGGESAPLVGSVPYAPALLSAPAPHAPAGVASPVAAPASPGAQATPGVEGKDIPSPMVGTFYSAPSPDAAPFVSVGQQISPDTTICIIEAMKVMNEIKAEVSGVVTEILAENGKPVQYGQPLFRIR